MQYLSVKVISEDTDQILKRSHSYEKQQKLRMSAVIL